MEQQPKLLPVTPACHIELLVPVPSRSQLMCLEKQLTMVNVLGSMPTVSVHECCYSSLIHCNHLENKTPEGVSNLSLFFKQIHKQTQVYMVKIHLLQLSNKQCAPRNPTAGCISIAQRSFYQRGICSTMFTLVPFTTAKIWNQTRYPPDEWKREMFTYTTEYYLE